MQVANAAFVRMCKRMDIFKLERGFCQMSKAKEKLDWMKCT